MSTPGTTTYKNKLLTSLFYSSVALVIYFSGVVLRVCVGHSIMFNVYAESLLIRAHVFLFFVISNRKLWLSISGWIALGLGQAISIVPLYTDMNRIAK